MDNRKRILTFLENITPLLSNNREEDIETIRILVDNIILDLGLDKSQLITKWVSIHGESAFKVLQVVDSETYFKVVSIILSSSLEYISKFNDPLYLIAQLSIISDWYSFGALNIK